MKIQKWELHKIDPQPNGELRWTIVTNGPIAYLTCEEFMAKRLFAAQALLENCEIMHSRVLAILNCVDAIEGLCAEDVFGEDYEDLLKDDLRELQKSVESAGGSLEAEVSVKEEIVSDELLKLPPHECGIYLTHNQNRDIYTSAADQIEEWSGRGPDWKNDEAKQRAAATNEIWTLQWYPHTPIGSEWIAAPTLKELIEFAQEFSTPAIRPS